MSFEGVPTPDTNPFESYEDARGSALMQTLMDFNVLYKQTSERAEQHQICKHLDEFFDELQTKRFLISGRVRFDTEPEAGISLRGLGRPSKDTTSASISMYYDVNELPLTVHGVAEDPILGSDESHLALLMTDPVDEDTEDESVYYVRVDELYAITPATITPEVARKKLGLEFPAVLAKINQLPTMDSSKQDILYALQKLDIRIADDDSYTRECAAYVEVLLNERYPFDRTKVSAVVGGLMYSSTEDGTTMQLDVKDVLTLDEAYLGSLSVEDITNAEGDHKLVPFLNIYLPHGNRMGDYANILLPVSSIGTVIDSPAPQTWLPENTLIFSQYSYDDPAVELSDSAGFRNEVADIYTDATEPMPYNKEMRQALEDFDSAIGAMLAELAAVEAPIYEEEDFAGDELKEYLEAVSDILTRFVSENESMLGQTILEVSGPSVVAPDIETIVEKDEFGERTVSFVRKGDGSKHDEFAYYRGVMSDLSVYPKTLDDGRFTAVARLIMTGEASQIVFGNEDGRTVKALSHADVIQADLDGSASISIPRLEIMRGSDRAIRSAEVRFADQLDILDSIRAVNNAVETETPHSYAEVDAVAIRHLFAPGKSVDTVMAIGDVLEGILGVGRTINLRGTLILHGDEDDTDTTYDAEEISGAFPFRFKYIQRNHPRIDTGPVLYGTVKGEEAYVIFDSVEEVSI